MRPTSAGVGAASKRADPDTHCRTRKPVFGHGRSASGKVVAVTVPSVRTLPCCRSSSEQVLPDVHRLHRRVPQFTTGSPNRFYKHQRIRHAENDLRKRGCPHQHHRGLLVSGKARHWWCLSFGLHKASAGLPERVRLALQPSLRRTRQFETLLLRARCLIFPARRLSSDCEEESAAALGLVSPLRAA